MIDAKIFSEYKRIMENEQKLAGRRWSHVIKNPKTIHGITVQLLEICQSCLVQRSYISRYHLSQAQIAYASVGAHTNIMMSLLDRAINYCFDEMGMHYICGYNYREVMEAARRHDLPENIIGDIPDDGTRDDKAKQSDEERYWEHFSSYSSGHESLGFEKRVNDLLRMMNERKTDVGNFLYLADKFSAIIEVLTYDRNGNAPMKNIVDRDLSPQDRESMKHCDYKHHGDCKASEMWTVGYFKQRSLTKKDKYGFYTAIVVMATLIVNERWYNWREKDYESFS